MNKNLIPAAQKFEATHGRISNFLIRLDQHPITNEWSWQMVFAGSPRVCPPELNKVISSEKPYPSILLCIHAAHNHAHKLSDSVFNQQLASKK